MMISKRLFKSLLTDHSFLYLFIMELASPLWYFSTKMGTVMISQTLKEQ